MTDNPPIYVDLVSFNSQRTKVCMVRLQQASKFSVPVVMLRHNETIVQAAGRIIDANLRMRFFKGPRLIYAGSDKRSGVRMLCMAVLDASRTPEADRDGNRIKWVTIGQPMDDELTLAEHCDDLSREQIAMAKRFALGRRSGFGIDDSPLD